MSKGPPTEFHFAGMKTNFVRYAPARGSAGGRQEDDVVTNEDRYEYLQNFGTPLI